MVGRDILLKIKPYQPGKPIEEVQRQLHISKVIKLASNENSIGPSKLAVNAIKESLNSLNRYPDGGCFYLRKALAKRMGLKPENLIFGNGSDEIITLAIKAFVDKGEEVVIAEPTFLIYKIATLVSGGNPKAVKVKDNFKYDLIGMRKAITKKTRIVFIGNPDNPLGTYVSDKEVAEFLSDIPKDVVVFFDEAYYEFAKDLKGYPCTLKYLNKRNIIIGRTFSKLYGLAGIRVGFGISNPKLISFMDRTREPFNVNSLAQVAALSALKDIAHVKKTLKLVQKGKRYLYNELRTLKLKSMKSATNFILINVGCNATTIFNKLLKRGVVVRDMNAWGLNNFIRVTIGTMAENRKFITELRYVLGEGE